MKKLKPNYLRYNFTILCLFFVIILPGCAVIKTLPVYSDQEIRQQLKAHNQNIQSLEYLEAQVAIQLQTPDQKGALYANLSFLTLDTLQMQFRDVLGRKVAKLDLFNNHYDLWLQRRGQHYSGSELPHDYRTTVFAKLTPREVRQLLLGGSTFTLDNRIQNDTIRSYSKNKLEVCIVLFKNSARIREIQFLNAQKNTLLKVLYQDFQSSNGVMLPTEVTMHAVEIPFEIRMHLSNISTKFRKLS